MNQNPFQTAAFFARLPMQMTLAYSQAFARKMPELVQVTLAISRRRDVGAADTAVVTAADVTAGISKTASDNAAPKPERKPGRPRRNATTSAENEAVTTVEAPATPKRKPGRPRKTAEPSATRVTEKQAESEVGRKPAEPTSKGKNGYSETQGGAPAPQKDVMQKVADQAGNDVAKSAKADSASSKDAKTSARGNSDGSSVASKASGRAKPRPAGAEKSEKNSVA